MCRVHTFELHEIFRTLTIILFMNTDSFFFTSSSNMRFTLISCTKPNKLRHFFRFLLCGNRRYTHIWVKWRKKAHVTLENHDQLRKSVHLIVNLNLINLNECVHGANVWVAYTEQIVGRAGFVDRTE